MKMRSKLKLNAVHSITKETFFGENIFRKILRGKLSGAMKKLCGN